MTLSDYHYPRRRLPSDGPASDAVRAARRAQTGGGSRAPTARAADVRRDPRDHPLHGLPLGPARHRVRPARPQRLPDEDGAHQRAGDQPARASRLPHPAARR